MTTITAFANNPLLNPPSDISYSMRDFFEPLDQNRLPLSGLLCMSTEFDISRVQIIAAKNTYVIDDAVVLEVNINPKLEPQRDNSIECSRSEAVFGVSAMMVSGLFIAATFLFPEVALPMFIVAGAVQLIGLSFLGASIYHGCIAKNITQKIENPYAHEEWIEKALADIIASRDAGFAYGLEYAVQNIPKAVFSMDERIGMYKQFLDQTLIGQTCISAYLNSPLSITARALFLL